MKSMPAHAAFVRLVLPLAAGLLLTAPAHARAVKGKVVDHGGQPVEFANVSAPVLKRGAVADESGAFTLELPDGVVALVVSQIGYQSARLTIDVHESLTALRVQLADEPVPVAEVSVEASSFGKTGKSEGAVVRRMDVYMTPGGAGDIFQSLRALPGINAPAEGAALYVRGGDPAETVIRIDGAEIGHPYHYEGASGGLFSILDTYMLKSAFFSSGGFAARYGGAMSGVLDIETQDPMNLKTVNVGANIVGASLSSTWALVPDKLSAMLSVNRSATSLLYKLYGSNREYVSPPTSFSGVGKLLYRYSPSGRVSLFDIVSTEDLRVIATPLNTRGEYASSARTQFLALHLQDASAGRIAVRANVSQQAYRSDWTYAPFLHHQGEHATQGLVDFVWPLGTRHELSFGGAWRQRGYQISGRAAADSNDLAQGAASRAFASDQTLREPGLYADDKLRVFGPVYATLGGRLDHAGNSGHWYADPRAAIAWRLDEHQTLRLATGRYHQLARVDQLDPRYGNPSLPPSYADHVIAGYEWKSDFGNIRIEGYKKTYHGLALADPVTWWRAAGTGYARGIDVFVQGTHGRLNGWVSYGYLDSKRREKDEARELPASAAVRHSVTLVSELQLTGHWSTGLRYSLSSGHPFTPVVGASHEPGRDVWHPIFGETNSGLTPTYHRADLRLTRLFSLPKGGGLPASNVCVFYAECMNILGTANVLDYSYSADYSQRITNRSYFGRRLVVAGFALSW